MATRRPSRAASAHAHSTWASWSWRPSDNGLRSRPWRSGAPVERRKLEQWFLRITRYADDLLESIATLENWPG